MDIVLETKNLCKYYGKGEGMVKAVNGTDLQIERGEFVTIVGKSGSGKSTLLNLLGGLDNPTSGEVRIDGQNIEKMKEDALCVLRRQKIGFVFQAFNLMPALNVWENIVLPLGLDGRKADNEYLHDIIFTLGLSEKLQSLPATLSGGQQQRVAIARAIASRPAIVLADEPTGNLDSKTSDEVMNMLQLSAQKYGQTLVVITHDDEIAAMGSRTIVIEDGRVVK